jgi:hypothetical protein
LQASVALIDVSEPTGNLMWEIEELTRRSQTRCVFICRHDRALQIATAAASVSPSSFDDDMGRLTSQRAPRLVSTSLGRKISPSPVNDNSEIREISP